jgi:hypothetical protein
MNFIIIIILKTITKLKTNGTTLNKINGIHSISLNDLCNNHGVGKKSFLTVNPLPILNTWRHVLSIENIF